MTPEERRAWIARRDQEAMRRNDQRRYGRHHQKRLAAMVAYQATEAGRAAATRAKAAWAARNREKRAAALAVNNAIRDGRLARGMLCAVAGFDCAGRIEAHHWNYQRPLRVTWLCRVHHVMADRLRRLDEEPEGSQVAA